MPQLDFVCGGIPCTGASRAGVSKNKLQFAEEHSTAGTLFFDYLEFVKATNPAVALVENVPEYGKSSSMAVIRSVLGSLGYDLFEAVLDGSEFGAIEARKRLCLVAITKGLGGSVEFVFPSASPGVQPGKQATLADVLEDIPLDSDRWKSYDYLAAKEERDIAAGKGFSRQLVRPDARTVGTIGRGYSKARSTEPFLQHPTSPDLSRLFTPVEHARIKGIPEYLVDGLAATTAHEVLGQSVIYPVFHSVGYAIGAAIQGLPLAPAYLAETTDPEASACSVTDYCSRVQGEGECGTGAVFGNGIDPQTRMLAVQTSFLDVA